VAGAQQLELIQDSQFPVVVADGGPPALTTPGSSGSSSHAGAAPVGIFQRMVAEASYLTKSKSLIFFHKVQNIWLRDTSDQEMTTAARADLGPDDPEPEEEARSEVPGGYAGPATAKARIKSPRQTTEATEEAHNNAMENMTETLRNSKLTTQGETPSMEADDGRSITETCEEISIMEVMESAETTMREEMRQAAILERRDEDLLTYVVNICRSNPGSSRRLLVDGATRPRTQMMVVEEAEPEESKPPHPSNNSSSSSSSGKKRLLEPLLLVAGRQHAPGWCALQQPLKEEDVDERYKDSTSVAFAAAAAEYANVGDVEVNFEQLNPDHNDEEQEQQYRDVNNSQTFPGYPICTRYGGLYVSSAHTQIACMKQLLTVRAAGLNKQGMDAGDHGLHGSQPVFPDSGFYVDNHGNFFVAICSFPNSCAWVLRRLQLLLGLATRNPLGFPSHSLCIPNPPSRLQLRCFPSPSSLGLLSSRPPLLLLLGGRLPSL